MELLHHRYVEESRTFNPLVDKQIRGLMIDTMECYLKTCRMSPR